jgi:hypothetical protein
MKNLILSIAFILAIWGCTKEVNLDQPSYESKIVVDGFIESGRAARVFLTLSSPYLTHYDSASIRNTFLNYAKITLTSSLGEEEVLTLYREDSFFPPFVYKSVSIRGKVGARYDLKVEVLGREAFASTIIPEPPSVTDAYFVHKTDTTGRLELVVESPIEDNLYLFTRGRSYLENESFHPSHDPVTLLDFSDSQSQKVRVLRSTEFGLYSMIADSAFYNDYERYDYDLRDTVDVIAGAVDAVAYRVLNSLFSDRGNQENPFAFNGNRIETNVNGGIGHWTGIGVSGVVNVTGN